ncbi:LOW QUALITY PROTEIN: Hypothetical protein PHPALM_13324 [Phytophthora palmivora]|uniref:Reverse transcriptase n=1 Tax=Phytophthora palmivora TaxID=4796 RepID=A0A2P4XXG2_9STRA|nr:LOW QUALITY PROTEIN: Hypothetical protein PHPALM_13324 [Phytophthora palmivora]
MYVEDIDQRVWDEYAERVSFALNTAQDRDQREDEIVNPVGGDTVSRSNISKHVNEKLRDAIQERADRNNETVRLHEIEVGTQVWLYLDRVKEGYACKLAHMWHGPFRVLELVEEHAVRLEIAGTEYRLFPVVHVSKIKPVRQFPDRPQMRLTIQDQDRYDFDEALLPEDSWIRDLESKRS